MSGRILAIGDIHGCNTALDTLLAAVRPTSGDTIVVLGDIVDRGPGTRACVDRLLELSQSLNLVHLMGNHEEMMISSADGRGWINSWLAYGGIETLQSYGRPPRFDNVPTSHWEFLRSGLDYYETGTEVFVHSNLEPNVSREQQVPDWLRWQSLRGDEPPDTSGKRVICGHTSIPDGVPAVLDGWVDIDTYCYGGQWLTCLDVSTDTVWQANQAGESRGPVALNEIAITYRPWKN